MSLSENKSVLSCSEYYLQVIFSRLILLCPVTNAASYNEVNTKEFAAVISCKIFIASLILILCQSMLALKHSEHLPDSGRQFARPWEGGAGGASISSQVTSAPTSGDFDGSWKLRPKSGIGLNPAYPSSLRRERGTRICAV